jgi:xanthine/uracil permease
MLQCGDPGMAGVAAFTGHLDRAAIGCAAFICFYLALSGWWSGGSPATVPRPRWR